VLAGPACQRPMPPLPHFLLSLPHSATGHRAPLPPGSACQPLVPSQPHPVALRCRATAPQPTPDGQGPLPATPRCRPLCRAPLRSFSYTPRGTEPTPPPFPSPPRAPSTFKSHRSQTSLPFFSIFFSIHSARRCLPDPPPSLSASFPVASLPHHWETEPPPASTFRPPSVSWVLHASWLASGVRLTFSPSSGAAGPRHRRRP
jgi:hypothetical protein